MPEVSKNQGEVERGRAKKEEKGQGWGGKESYFAPSPPPYVCIFSHLLAVKFIPFACFWK